MDHGACSYRRFLEGDESAFDELMEELFDHLVFFLNRYVRDTYAAEDIAIDVFSDLVVNRHRYNFKVTLKTYVFMLGRSRALNYLKHHKVLTLTPLSEAEQAASGEKLPEEQVLANERKRAVHAALSTLPEDMRVAVHLFYLEDMTYAQIAKIMRKSQKQVDNLLYRAKKELRVSLGKDGKL